MHVLIAGGSGLLGGMLTRKFTSKDIAVTVLSRTPENTIMPKGARVVAWDAKTTEYWAEKIKPMDAVINLTGEHISGTGLVAKSWNDAHKKAIKDSRVDATKALVEWIQNTDHVPKVFIQQSGIDYYALSPKPTGEDGPKGDSFLSQVAQEWEAAAHGIDNLPIRFITTRTAPVMHPDRPPLLQWTWSSYGFLGGIAGDGTQMFSWIHIEDYCNVVVEMVLNDSYRGAYNVCSPQPLSYEKLMKGIGNVTGKPIWMKQPEALIKSILGEASTLALDSRCVVPTRILNETPFTFKHPEFEKAIDHLINL